ncbi:hypothetical protein AMK32_12605 [Streptomyces sp. CB01883]|nr:hypothetical protein AMK32_12605 [Streptomyces sp. CB01883]
MILDTMPAICVQASTISRWFRFRSLTTAPSSSAVSAAAPLNACRVIMLVSRSCPANGPVLRAAATIANVDTASAHGAAPASWNRNAAQTSSGNPRKSSGARPVSTNPTAAVATTSSPASTHRDVRTFLGHRAELSTSSTGVTTRTPMASPVHHTDQVGQKPAVLSAPETSRVVVPVVALTSIPVNAPRKIRPRTSRSRSSSLRNPARRSNRQEQTGARVFPAVIARTAGSDGPRPMLARNAPSATPGHTRLPRSSRLATAIPLGGHSGVTWLRTSCCSSPSSAEPKYRAAMTQISRPARPLRRSRSCRTSVIGRPPCRHRPVAHHPPDPAEPPRHRSGRHPAVGPDGPASAAQGPGVRSARMAMSSWPSLGW